MSANGIALASAAISLLAAAGAWAAVLVQRRNATDTIRAQINIGARNSRANVVSANRQKWIDAFRDDVSEFIALKTRLIRLSQAGSSVQSGIDALQREERDLRERILMIRIRVELRTNREEDAHVKLIQAMDAFDSNFTLEADQKLRDQASAIFRSEWLRLKKEASGIDPFVREQPRLA